MEPLDEMMTGPADMPPGPAEPVELKPKGGKVMAAEVTRSLAEVEMDSLSDVEALKGGGGGGGGGKGGGKGGKGGKAGKGE
jgi:hypothetical protein